MLEPAARKILVKVEEVEERTKSGLYIVDTDKKTEANIFGTIVAIGLNCWKSFDDGTPWATVGDRIAFAKYGGFIIIDPDTEEKFRLLNDEDVCAIVR